MNLKTLVQEREDTVGILNGAKQKLAGIEERVVDELVKQRHFNMFNVNWRKLNRAIRQEQDTE